GHAGRQPLTAPAVMPRTKNRCKDKNTMIGTIIEKNPPAVTRFHPSPCWLSRLFWIATVTGALSPGPISTSATNRSFQTHRNWKIANDASAGTDIGRISRQKVWKWLAPSIFADSITLTGSVAM